jgi:hypothetical protein
MDRSPPRSAATCFNATTGTTGAPYDTAAIASAVTQTVQELRVSMVSRPAQRGAANDVVPVLIVLNPELALAPDIIRPGMTWPPANRQLSSRPSVSPRVIFSYVAIRRG